MLDGLLDGLRSLLRPEPLETTYDEAAEAYRERHADRLAEVDEEADAVRAAVADAVAELEVGLEALEGFEDDRDPVEDILENVATRRRALLDDLRLPEDPEALGDAVEAFLEARSDTSRKEAAALQQIELPARYRSAVEELEAAVDRLDRFLSSEYALRETARELDGHVERRREALAAVEELRETREGLPLAERREELAERERERERYREGEEWAAYRRLEKELDDARTRRDAAVARVNEAVAKTGRGLKKLIYRAEQGDVDLGADVDLLEDLRDGDTEAVLARDPDRVAAAADAVRDAVTGEYVEGSDRERLSEGLEALEGLPEEADRIGALDEEIAGLESRVDEHPAPDRVEELEEAVAELEGAVEELERRRDEIEDRIEDELERVRAAESRIEELLEEAVAGEVRLRDGADGGD